MEVVRSQKASANEILNSFVGIAGRKEAEFRVPHQFHIKGHSRARLRAIKKVSVWQVESQSIVGSYPFLAGLRFPMQIGQGE
jgi:hypothetical protein